MLPHSVFNLLAYRRIVPQKLFGILAALADFISVVGIPCAGLVYNIHAGRQVQNIPGYGDPFPEHNVKLRLLEWRGNLVLHHFDPGVVADDLPALFQ